MLTVSTWLWGNKYNVDYVAKLAKGVARNLLQPHRFVVLADEQNAPKLKGGPWIVCPIEHTNLLTVKGCFVRLQMFSPEWQAKHGVTDRLVNIDLDTVITGPLDSIFDRPEPFAILQGGNATNPCPYGGALMMLRAWAHPEVWSDFSLKAAGKVPFDSFPDDQGWIWAKIPNAAGWKAGAESGVYVFRKPGWPGWTRLSDSINDALPPGARLVTFSGWRSPEKFAHLDWVKQHWR